MVVYRYQLHIFAGLDASTVSAIGDASEWHASQQGPIFLAQCEVLSSKVCIPTMRLVVMILTKMQRRTAHDLSLDLDLVVADMSFALSTI